MVSVGSVVFAAVLRDTGPGHGELRAEEGRTTTSWSKAFQIQSYFRIHVLLVIC
jgi:hypothetical protein